MNNFIALFCVLIAITACSGASLATDPTGCHEGRAFMPGPRVVSCELFDSAGAVVRKVYVSDLTARQWHCAPDASYVRCSDDELQPATPLDTRAPLCAFIGQIPQCMNWNAGISEPAN